MGMRANDNIVLKYKESILALCKANMIHPVTKYLSILLNSITNW